MLVETQPLCPLWAGQGLLLNGLCQVPAAASSLVTPMGADSQSHPSAPLSKEPSADLSWSSGWNRGLQYGKQIYMNSPSSPRPLKEIRDVWAAQLQFRCLRRAAFTMAWTPLLLMLLSHCTCGDIPQRHTAAPQSMLASLAQNLRQLNSGPCPGTHMYLRLQVPSPSLC